MVRLGHDHVGDCEHYARVGGHAVDDVIGDVTATLLMIRTMAVVMGLLLVNVVMMCIVMMAVACTAVAMAVMLGAAVVVRASVSVMRATWGRIVSPWRFPPGEITKR